MLLQEMEMFYYVVKLGSFSQAAERLTCSKAHISRSISKLEHELKTQLLHRSTRHLSLSESGEKLFQHCQNLIAEAENAYAVTSHYQQKPSGTLRITAPSAFSSGLLAKFIPGFIRRYPEIKLTIELENKVVDILAEGIDIALRTGELKDSQLIAQPLAQFDSIICAAPSYLKKHGAPKTPHDLSKHNCCLYQQQLTQKTWTLSKGKTSKKIMVQGNVVANQAEFLKQVALAGVGIANLPPFMVEAELKKGLLTRCLPGYTSVQQQFFAIYPSKRFLPPKTKVFIHELKAFLKEKSHLD